MKHRPRHNTIGIQLAAVFTITLFLSGCLSSVVKTPIQELKTGPRVDQTLVVGRLVADRTLNFGAQGTGPQRVNLAMQKAFQKSPLFKEVVREADIPLKGLQRAGKVFLVKYRIQDYRFLFEESKGLIALAVFSFLLIPMAFWGLCRHTVTENYNITMKVFDVTGAKLERVKDESTAEWFNAYNVSNLAPVTSRTYDISVLWKQGYDNAMERAMLQEELAKTCASQLIKLSLDDIARAVSSQ